MDKKFQPLKDQVDYFQKRHSYTEAGDDYDDIWNELYLIVRAALLGEDPGGYLEGIADAFGIPHE